MKKHHLFTGMLALSLFLSFQLSAQVSISPDNSPADPSAGLDVNFPNKGVVLPRMTRAGMNAIVNPVNGLMVFCTDCGSGSAGSLSIFINGSWNIVYTTNCSIAPPSAGLHVASKTQIVWNWNTASGASGYKWNTINDFTSATDLGTSTSKTETGLASGTPYTRYVWAYNTCGNSLVTTLTQSTLAWACGEILTDSRDNKSYNTVLIGSQCWMQQNLNIGMRINGGVNQTNNGILEKYCYNNDENNCNIYGGLYQWDEAMQYSTTEGVKGICPTGWHLPTDAEWTTLTNVLGGENVAGGRMKEAGTTHWASPNTGATNSSGFTALPGGYRHFNGDFYTLTISAIFRSSSQYDATYAWDRDLSPSDENVRRYPGGLMKAHGFSARCLKD